MKIKLPFKSKRIRQEQTFRWNDKFAWLPTIVDEEQDNFRVVWGRRYMRKHLRWERKGRKNEKQIFEKYSMEEFLKKQLAGDFQKDFPRDAEGPEVPRVSSPHGHSVSFSANDMNTGIAKGPNTSIIKGGAPRQIGKGK